MSETSQEMVIRIRCTFMCLSVHVDVFRRHGPVNNLLAIVKAIAIPRISVSAVRESVAGS